MTVKEIEDYFYCESQYKIFKIDEKTRPDEYCVTSCSLCPHFFKLIAISR